ncbi:hypothetical protein BDV96DRAFT_262036 [Lophiotrema nucula]|uniref:Uncharacterized protein n=1 Tax=Lophiotrema nucula TaxID=690887 RepID=A0A6A5YMN8_9PLEO|nr:hypothetical protein BDV96DRAFT_262036 [Lophiotrema nucula]
MPNISFLDPNTAALPRSQHIPEHVWEEHKTDIIRAFLTGGTQGNAHALRFIKNRKIPGFNPTAKQLRHRILVHWKADISWSQLNSVAKITSNVNECRPEAPSRPSEKPTFERLSVSQQSASTDQLDRSQRFADVPSTIVAASDQPELLQTSVYEPQSPRSRNVLLSATVEDVTSPGPAHGSTFGTGEKKRERSLDKNTKRVLKRHRQKSDPEDLVRHTPLSDVGGGEAYHSHPRGPPMQQPLPKILLDSNVSSPDSAFTHLLEDISFSPVWSSDGSSTTRRSSMTAGFGKDYDIPSSSEPVIDPKRLQKILVGIGITWDLDIVSQCLRRDIIFRTSIPPSHNLPDMACSKKHFKKIQACAEFFFHSSILDHAFPLLLQVWVRRRGEIGYNGLKTLLQCAESAVRSDDRDLIMSILARELALMDKNFFLESNLIGCLMGLELSHAQYYAGKEIGDESPHQSPLFQMFQLDRARRRLHGPDCVRCHTVSEIFKLAALSNDFTCLTDCNEWVRNERSTSSVLLAIVCLTQHQGSFDVESSIRRLRNCLQHAISIFEKPMLSNTIFWHEQIHRNWPTCSRDRKVELSVFFFLWTNWPTQLYPSSNLALDEEDIFLGVSTLQIISVISSLALKGNDIPGVIDLRQLQGITLKARALVDLPDVPLLFGFLSSSLQLNRERCNETPDPKFLSLFEEVAMDVFQGTYERADNATRPQRHDHKIRSSALTDISANPTITSSLSTSSTLSSMRRYSRMFRFSSLTRRSNETVTMDDLSDRASFLTISDIQHSSMSVAQDNERSSIQSLIYGRISSHLGQSNGSTEQVGSSESIPILPD